MKLVLKTTDIWNAIWAVSTVVILENTVSGTRSRARINVLLKVSKSVFDDIRGEINSNVKNNDWGGRS